MATELTRLYNQGYNDSKDRADLSPGEMQTATGVYYKPGNPKDAFKMNGRSTFADTSSAAKVGGVAIALFDSGTDKVLALSSGVLYSSTPGATGTFSTLYTLSGTGAKMDAAHAADEWFLALQSENRVLSSDGTLREMGMQPPVEPLTVAESGAASLGTVRPTAKDDGWNNMANAYDAGTELLSTYSHAEAATAGSTVGIWSGWASNTGTSRRLRILWGLQSTGHGWTDRPLGDFLSKIKLSANITIKLEFAENGSTYSTIFEFTGNSPQGRNWVEVPITDTTVNLNTLTVRATLTYVSGTKTVSFMIYDIKVIDAPAVDKTATGLKYAYTEWDQTKGDGGESVPSPVAEIAITAKVAVNITLPAAATNSRATHWRIYRTPDKGSEQQLGLIGSIPIAQTAFQDDFSEWDVDEQPVPLINYVEFESEGAVLRSPRDFPPPNLRRLTYFKGGFVGLSDVNKRGLFYAVPGYPESWPQLYVFENFPLPENDTLVDVQEIGGLLIIGAKDVMIRLEEVPRSVSGVFVASEAIAIAGAPGVVGDYGMTVINYQGASHVAWISPDDGVLVTDGHSWQSISDDIDWGQFEGFDKSGWVLRYLKHLRVLVLAYSSTASGGNDRYFLLHVGKNHVKQGNQAKITGPHYGKIADLAAGRYSNTTRVYTGHWSDGKVYLELDSNTGADSSLAYNASGEWPMIIKGRRAYDADWAAYTALDARLYHGDFGVGQTVTVKYETGRDASDESSDRTQSVSLASRKGTQFDIARSGEWHEETLTHTGTGRADIGSLTVRSRKQGDEGKMTVVK